MFVDNTRLSTMTHLPNRTLMVAPRKQKGDIKIKMNKAHRQSVYIPLPTEGKLAPQLYANLK